MIYIGIGNANSISKELISELPASAIEHIKQNKSALSAARTSCALILHTLIKKHAPELVPYEITYTELGKPYIAGMQKVGISISHANDNCVAVALCLGEDAGVGIDIEEIKKYDPRISKKYFSGKENERLASLSFEDAADEFTKLWTRYESKAKYSGGGLADMRKDIDAFVRTSVVEICERRYALSIASRCEYEIDIEEF